MNKDCNLIFEQYKSRVILNELDLGANYGTFGAAVSKGVGEREKTNDTYIFKLLKSALNKSAEEVADILAKPIYDELFPGGKFMASGERREQLSKLQNAIQQKLPAVMQQLKSSYPELENVKGLSSSALHGYTARIFKNFVEPVLQVLGDEAQGDEPPSEGDVQDAVVAAVQQVASKPTPSAEPQSTDSEPAGDAPVSDAPTAEPTSNKYIEAAKKLVYSVEGGMEMSELAKEIGQLYVQSDPEISSKSAETRATGLIKGLINRGIFDTDGSMVVPGESGDDIEDSGDTEDVGLDPEEYAAKHFGAGRSTTGRSFWSQQY
jgi:hypothetical protein